MLDYQGRPNKITRVLMKRQRETGVSEGYVTTENGIQRVRETFEDAVLLALKIGRRKGPGAKECRQLLEA